MHRGKERASSSLECWREEEKKEKEKKELRLFADDGLAAAQGKIFPEERVEFRDLARSIMFAFSSRLAECCLVPSTKTKLPQGVRGLLEKLRIKSCMELFLTLLQIV